MWRRLGRLLLLLTLVLMAMCHQGFLKMRLLLHLKTTLLKQPILV